LFGGDIVGLDRLVTPADVEQGIVEFTGDFPCESIAAAAVCMFSPVSDGDI